MSHRNFRQDLLAGAADLAPFFRYSILEPDFETLIQDRSQVDIDRDALVEDLLAQNAPFREASRAMENIELLRSPKTFTVTTGHQLSLMGGPMYMIYKISTIIKLAQNLTERYPDYNFVPVFWMASEDHDWEEINHFHPDYHATVTYPGQFEGPVGRHLLEVGIQDTLADIPIDLRSCYAPLRNLSDAFRQLILKLFGEHGLVVLDADRPALKRLLLPWIERELKGEGMGAAVQKTTEQLEELGYKAQIFPRELNLFYMGEGKRELLFQEGDRIRVQDGHESWRVGEMLEKARLRPEDFSPNVAMRPLYQEIILPNLVYTGGWAEVTYWHQLHAGFREMGVHFPMVLPRMSATLYQSEVVAPLLAEGLDPAAIDRPLHELFRAYHDNHDDTSVFETLFSQLDASYQALAGFMEETEPTLVRTVLGQQQRNGKFRENLLKKWRKNIRNAHPEPFRKLEEAQNAVQPEGFKQERYLNFTHFLNGDYKTLVDLILDHCEPETFEPQWIPLP